MATYAELLQGIYHRYEKEHDGLPSTPRQVVAWAVAKGLLERPRIDPLDALGDAMARALREEVRTDERGRRYRVNHAIRITRDGVQTSLWAELDSAPREHMVEAFAQRRRQIVGDCVQLRTDVDVYNDKRSAAPAIQVVLDFTDDVAEALVSTSKSAA